MSAEEKGIPGDPMQGMNWLRPNLTVRSVPEAEIPYVLSSRSSINALNVPSFRI